jgi:hypothetical protein
MKNPAAIAPAAVGERVRGEGGGGGRRTEELDEETHLSPNMSG